MDSVSYQQRRLPAEWEKQEAVLLAWPDQKSDWHETLPQVEAVLKKIVQEIARREKVLLVGTNPARVEKILGVSFDKRGRGQIEFYSMETNDIWARDFGPITVLDQQERQFLDFQFNGWGEKYPWKLDNQVTAKLTRLSVFENSRYKPVDLILEGGSIDSNGEGTILTTTSCLCNPNRNQKCDQQEIEKQLQSLFGAKQVLWLDYGHIEGDDTDGHIDTLARFVASDTIAYVNASPRMEEELKAFRTPEGRPFTLVPLPSPGTKVNQTGQVLPATYANFLVINQAVLVPTYDDKHDEEALQTIRQLFPEREVIGIPCLPIIEQFGSLHCLTMQIPAG